MKKNRKFWSALPLVVLLFSPLLSFSREVTLTLLFTGDHRGQLDPLHGQDGSGAVGGVTRRMALIQKIRQEVGPDHVVLVDSGDIIDGSAFSELTRGEADCDAYHLMGYDAICLGEHDFDYGAKTLLQYRRDHLVPWVAANVNRGGQPFIRAYILKATGVRVGLIGFADKDTPSLIGRDSTRGLVFNPPGLVAKGLHSIFKKDADIFIALDRQGLEDTKKFAKDNPFLHVVIASKGDQPLKEPLVTRAKDGSVSGPIVCQAVSHGRYLGRLDLTVEGHRDLKTKTSTFSVTDYHYQMIPITADLPEDPKMVDLLQGYRDKLKEKPLDEVLATVTGDFLQDDQGDSMGGKLLADAVREATGAELALVPNQVFQGSFRGGPLTREILYEICPSEGGMTALDVTGKTIRAVLREAWAQKGKEGFLQVSGLTITHEGDDLDIRVGTEPLNDKKRYRIAVTDYLASGGSGYEVFRTVKSRQKFTTTLRGLLESALKKRGTIAAADLDTRWK